MVTSKDEMTPDELYKIAKIAKNIGVKKIRLSGGDPLVRKDIVEIVEKIASLDFKDISLTTNGVLLEKVQYLHQYSFPSRSISRMQVKVTSSPCSASRVNSFSVRSEVSG